MRLILGIVIFCAWSFGSGYWYVCKIKGLCNVTEQQSIKKDLTGAIVADSVNGGEMRDVGTVPNADSSLDSAMNTGLKVESDALTEVKPPQALLVVKSLRFSFARPIMENKAGFKAYVEEMSSFLKANSQYKVGITGFTDDTAARQNNLKLGMRRAEAVADMFRLAGVAEGQMTIASRGEENPVATNETRAGRKQNRRAEIKLITP